MMSVRHKYGFTGFNVINFLPANALVPVLWWSETLRDSDVFCDSRTRRAAVYVVIMRIKPLYNFVKSLATNRPPYIVGGDIAHPYW